MKKTKKLAAVLLALILCLSLSVAALADGQYKISIQNDVAGHTYSAYQIFAGNVAHEVVQGEAESGPILSNITWGNGVDGAGLLADLQETYPAKYGECTTAADVAEAIGKTAADAEAFAKIANQHLTGPESSAERIEGGHYTISGLSGGYYLVKDTGNIPAGQTATDYIVQVLGNVTMDPKDTDIPELEKKVFEESYGIDGGYGTGYNDVADYDIGDTVPFKIIGTVPSAADLDRYDTYKYIIHDVMDAGLTLDTDSIKVFTAATKDAATGTDLTGSCAINTQPADESFTVSFTDIKTVDGLSNYIIVTFNATLNANAEIGLPGNENEAYLEFTNNPISGGTGETTADKVIVFTYEIDGTKVDKDNHDTKLKDAEFVLLNDDGTKVAHVENGKFAGWVDASTASTEEYVDWYNSWVLIHHATPILLTSAADGTFGVSGLDDGTYQLVEIKSPSGYNRLEAPITFTIDATTDNGQNWGGVPGDALTALSITVGDANGDGNVNTGAVSLNVENDAGTLLPETGGIGTTIFYVLGGVLIVGAAVILVVRRRVSGESK